MSEPRENHQIGVGVLGFGFMGQTHARAFQHAQRDGYKCRLIAIGDNSLRSLDDVNNQDGNIGCPEPPIDLDGLTLVHTPQELFEIPEIELISICTHTDSHVDLAIEALNAGKHVLVEKPIAIDQRDVHRLASASSASDRICLPAMCMRFWPAWVRIKELIDSRRYGSVRSAVFHRLGSRPAWAPDFYGDETRSGGVLTDLHIHDTDFIVHCFGVPASVTSSGDAMHLSTIYHYADAPIHVMAHAAWDQQPSVGFRMQCTIICQRATIEFDIAQENQLILYQGDGSTPINVGDLNGYDGVIRAMLDAIAGDRSRLWSNMDDALCVARVLDHERQSMLARSTIPINLSDSYHTQD